MEFPASSIYSALRTGLRLDAIGHTSGWDTFSGMLHTLSAFSRTDRPTRAAAPGDRPRDGARPETLPARDRSNGR
ncbi:hypothetical protein [Pseudodesulfovibrio indicus]|nr:hypothetical protein [Pseudodesulfovibrio indicus]TDT86275.1 hypothetical protein EDC59_11440 [Pseudodesulfovibrio indicus]